MTIRVFFFIISKVGIAFAVLRIAGDNFGPEKMNGSDTDFKGRNHRKS